MAAPKLYSQLYVEKDEEKNLRDKKLIEALRTRLNERLQKNPRDCKKAAAILESWLKNSSKP